MVAMPQTVYKKTSLGLLFELRDLFHEHPFLAYRGSDTVCHALRMLRGVEAETFEVEVALEALHVESEILS